MSYNVVFEYDENSGGLFGVRTWTSYTSKEEFESLYHDRKGEIVLKADVTEDEAVDLTSLSPEICRLMGALEQLFYENADPSNERLKHALQNARYAIEYDRKLIAEKSLVRPDATKYIKHIKTVIKTDKLSHKSACMSVILLMNLNRFGEVL